jgi:hypothetical protein
MAKRDETNDVCLHDVDIVAAQSFRGKHMGIQVLEQHERIVQMERELAELKSERDTLQRKLDSYESCENYSSVLGCNLPD